VIGTASAGKRDLVMSLGADEVVDYQASDFSEAVRDADVVFDVVGGGNGERSLAGLRPGGHLVTALDHSNAGLRAKTEAAGLRFSGIAVEPDDPGLDALTRLADEGRLRPYVTQTFPLRDAAKAHELVEAGGLQGKVVLTVR
jgi:NADPH:quinone reductase-like Zn-dependent oxidoreductase